MGRRSRLALLFFILCSVSFVTSSVWTDFKGKYGRHYPSQQEEQRRHKIFRENVEIANGLNKKANGTTVYGITQFMDLTRDEFRGIYLGADIEGLSALPLLNWTQSDQPAVSTSFSWVERGVTTPIYNQGQCGSCWAFSVTEQFDLPSTGPGLLLLGITEQATLMPSTAILDAASGRLCLPLLTWQHESMRAIAGYGLASLSMQQVLDCASGGGDEGCAGGYPLSAWAYLANVGQESYQAYPYVGEQTSCHYDSTAVPTGAFVSNYGLITSTGDESVMLDYLTNSGPISVCVDAANWQYYNSGVIMADQCGDQVDHCVQIVGVVEDIEGSGVSAWYVRNSWGTSWGYSGYCYVEAGANACDIASVPTSCTV